MGKYPMALVAVPISTLGAELAGARAWSTGAMATFALDGGAVCTVAEHGVTEASLAIAGVGKAAGLAIRKSAPAHRRADTRCPLLMAFLPQNDCLKWPRADTYGFGVAGRAVLVRPAAVNRRRLNY